MPETTINMTCSRTGKHMELRLGAGGEVKSRVLDGKSAASEAASEE